MALRPRLWPGVPFSRLASPRYAVVRKTSRGFRQRRSGPHRPQQGGPHSPERVAGRPAHWLPGVGELVPRSSSRGDRLTDAFAVWPWELQLPSPNSSRAVWFASASAASPAESRINLLHGTSRRYCDADGTRDWSRLSTPKGISSRLGDDKIGSEMRARKSRFSYPQACTFLTFPQRRTARPKRLCRPRRTIGRPRRRGG